MTVFLLLYLYDRSLLGNTRQNLKNTATDNGIIDDRRI